MDHARVKRDLDKALREAQKTEKRWSKKKNEAGGRVVTCVAGVVQGIIAALDEDEEEEFMGLDGGDSDSEEEDTIGLKASLVATLAVVQVTLVACLAGDKRFHDKFDYSRRYLSPSSFDFSDDPILRSKLFKEISRTQNEKRVERAAKERDDLAKRKNVRAGLAKVVCQMARGTWDSLVPETLLQRRTWETQADFWSDMKGLEDGDGEEAKNGDDDDDDDEEEEERKFNELERAALAALKLLGYGNFKLFSNLFQGVEEWESPDPVNFADMKRGEDSGESDEEEVEPLHPERMGKLSGNEKISSWLKSVTSSPTSTPDVLEEALGEEEMTEPGDAVAADSAMAEIPDMTLEKASATGEGHEDEDIALTVERDRPVATRQVKQSKNAKLASIWQTKSRKKASKARKENLAKALEKAKEARIRRKLEQERIEAKKRERAARREEPRLDGMGAEVGQRKTHRLGMIGQRKRQSRAQKEQTAKALEKAREAVKAKTVREAVGRA